MDKSYGRVKHITPNGGEMSKNNPNRDRRLAEALRANLRKRKDQQRDNPVQETGSHPTNKQRDA
jgi:hypothetical protein